MSLPYVAALVDGKKYMDPADVKPSQEPPAPDAAQPGAGKRAFEQTQRLPRAPTLRSLVKLALKCDSAEEMGSS